MIKQINIISELKRNNLWDKKISPTIELLLEISQRLSLQSFLDPSNLFLIRTVKESTMVKKFLEECQKLPKPVQENTVILNEKGKLEFTLWKFQEAVESFTMAAKMAKNREQKGLAKFNLFQALIQRGQMYEAVQAYRDAIRLVSSLNLFDSKNYRVLEVFGVGWWGIEFLCTNRNNEHFVIKCIMDTKNIDLPKLNQELLEISKLDSPFIFDIYDLQLENKELPPHIVVKCTQGTSLNEYVANTHQITESQAIELLKKIAQGLHKAHNQGIKHLDIKPKNVIVEEESLTPVVINFGLYIPQGQLKEYSIAINKKGNMALSLLAEDIVESLEYRAPELKNEPIAGKVYPVNFYTDVFSFGKVACHLLFKSTRISSQQLQKVENKNFAEVLERCIAENPSNRYQSFSSVFYLLSSYKLGYKCYIEKDYRNAISHFQKAIESEDHPLAQYAIGTMYELGEGFDKKPVWAKKWKKMAFQCDNVKEVENLAKNGDILAQNLLGYLYFYGIKVAQDFEVSRGWWEKSAKKEHPTAQMFLGNIFHRGLGIAKDVEQANKWYRRASNRGNITAQYLLGYMLQYNLDKPKFAEAREQFERAAQKEYAPAQTSLGYIYRYGIGVAQNNYEAKLWLEQGVEQDYGKALNWFSKAAVQGYPIALFHLGIMHFYGLGTQQNQEKAIKFFEQAATRKYFLAQYVLCCIYYHGLGVAPDSQKAWQWLKKSNIEKESIWLQKILKELLEGVPSFPPVEFPMLLEAKVPAEDKWEWWMSAEEKNPTIKDIQRHFEEKYMEQREDYLSEEEVAALSNWDEEDNK